MSLSSSPLITIITPVFNAEKYLDETIKSVQSQTYQNYEHLLVIDINSTDSSLGIALRAQSKDPRVRTIQDSEALGASANRNIGIDFSRGEYLAFLDADDTWPPEKLEKQLKFSIDNNALFSFTAFRRMSEDGAKFSPATTVPISVNYHDLLKLNVIALHTVLLKKECVSTHRFPNVVHEDFAFWLELLRPRKGQAELIAMGLNEPLANYRSVKGSRAFDKKKAALWRWKILREYEKLPLWISIYYFAEYAFRATILHQKTKV